MGDFLAAEGLAFWGFDAGHRVGVHVLSAPEGVAAVGSFPLETELLVEGDARVVSIHESSRSLLSRSA